MYLETEDNFVFCTGCNSKVGALYSSYGEKFIVFNNLREVQNVFEGFATNLNDPTQISFTMSTFPVAADDITPIDSVDLEEEIDDYASSLERAPTPCNSLASSHYEDDSSRDGSEIRYANSLEDVSSDELSDSEVEEVDESEPEIAEDCVPDVLAYLNEQSAQADSAIGLALRQLQSESQPAPLLDEEGIEELPEDIIGILDNFIQTAPDFIFNYTDDHEL